MISRIILIRSIFTLVIFLSITASVGLVLLLESKQHVFLQSSSSYSTNKPLKPFPVSVNLTAKTISENPAVNDFFVETLATAPESKNNWWNKLAAIFFKQEWYQNLASPVGRIIVIWPGDRKEEAAKSIGDILGWNRNDRNNFLQLVDSSTPVMAEGKYYPGQYVAHTGATPEEIKNLIEEEFQTKVLNRYTPEVESQVPLNDALIIASLLEREASDFENMREISGVIWNRLFIDMPLQLDATLQYVRGSSQHEPKWWPSVRPNDKYLKSAYNTYKNTGLPPAPIANPSAEALLAALNPTVTDCLFYFHTDGGKYHCSVDYEEHVTKLKSIYGRGR